jgi:hypothetical protein
LRKDLEDGRTILKKAQERKKISNLEMNKGKTKTHNSFSALSSDEIGRVADLVGVSVGGNPHELSKVVFDIVELDKDRVARLSKVCTRCSHVSVKGDVQPPGLGGRE